MPLNRKGYWVMIDEAYAMTGGGGEGGPGAFTGFVFPLVIVMAIFYFILIRPQLKRQKQHTTSPAKWRKAGSARSAVGL